MGVLPDGYATLESALTQLAPIKPGEWQCRCPAHDDHKPSLWIAQRHDRLVISCRAGCDNSEIMRSLGLGWGALFSGERSHMPRIVATYDYTDERGQLLYQAVRFDPKDFRQRRKSRRGEDSKDGWVWSLAGCRRVLYQLPRVAASPAVILVEGEKDADRVNSLDLSGVAATCNPMGAGKWCDDYSQQLSGKRLVILPDNDPPGRDHAARVAESVKSAAKSVRVVEIPGLPDKGDVSDWLDQHSRDDFVAILKKPPAGSSRDALLLLGVALSGSSEAAAAGNRLAKILRDNGVLR